jgi:hypothetical protein
MILSRRNTAPGGVNRPCSQSRNVATGVWIRSANCGCESPSAWRADLTSICSGVVVRTTRPSCISARLSRSKALGKVDEHGNVAEDLRSQILGQLSERINFLKRAAMAEGWTFEALGDNRYRLTIPGAVSDTVFSIERDDANADDGLSLMGLDHHIIAGLLDKYRSLAPEEIGLAVRAPGGRTGVLAFWAVDWLGPKNQTHHVILRLAVDTVEQRIPVWEHQPEDLLFADPMTSQPLPGMLEITEAIVERELRHRGLVKDHQPYSGKLIGWVAAV